MTGIGYKLFLTIVAPLNAVKHSVDNHGQILQFVLCSRNIDPVRQIAFRKRFSHVCDIPDRCQHAFVQPLVIPEKIEHSEHIAQQYAAGDHHPENPDIVYIQRYKPVDTVVTGKIKAKLLMQLSLVNLP